MGDPIQNKAALQLLAAADFACDLSGITLESVYVAWECQHCHEACMADDPIGSPPSFNEGYLHTVAGNGQPCMFTTYLSMELIKNGKIYIVVPEGS